MSERESHGRCSNCGAHEIMHTGTEALCCGCYVKAGNSPADWHTVCMATYRGETVHLNRYSFAPLTTRTPPA